ncbi:hypothetical protein D9M69_396390 [compost metagenome]
MLQVEPRFLAGQVLAIEHAHDGILAEQARHDGDPDIHVALVDDGAEAAVLRNTPLGYVQLGEHLDPGDDLIGQFSACEVICRDQHAIKAQPDDQPRCDVLQVDVAGLAVQGVQEDGIQATDGGVLFL